jgi:DNA-binding transcriptional MerR regulator
MSAAAASGDAASPAPERRGTASGLSAGQVARRLGVAVTTIRTWDRRYGLGPSVRQEGRHRRYDEHDLRRLQAMRRMIADGVAPAEAARIVLAGPPPDRPGGAEAVAPPAAPPATAASGLRRAAMALDAAQMDRILGKAVTDDVVTAWTGLICPVLDQIGRKHAQTGAYVEAEHLLSQTVSRALARVDRPQVTAAVLLACTPDEQHTLALEALAAALAVGGVACRLLGARVPTDALIAAVRRTGPTAVMLWAHRPETADVDTLQALLAVRPRPALIAVGGSGWAHVSVPGGVAAPEDLSQALAAIAGYPPAGRQGA